MITASQCRAARGLLDWTQQELADAAHVGVATVRLFEAEASDTRHATLEVLRRAFELAGVEFTDENPVAAWASTAPDLASVQSGSRDNPLGSRWSMEKFELRSPSSDTARL